MGRKAARVEQAIELREPVMNAVSLEIVDDDSNASDALRFGEEAHDFRRLQVMEKETAGDDIDAVSGKWQVERIPRDDTRRGKFLRPGLRVRKMARIAVQQRDLPADAQSLDCIAQHLCLAAGNF